MTNSDSNELSIVPYEHWTAVIKDCNPICSNFQRMVLKNLKLLTKFESLLRTMKPRQFVIAVILPFTNLTRAKLGCRAIWIYSAKSCFCDLQIVSNDIATSFVTDYGVQVIEKCPRRYIPCLFLAAYNVVHPIRRPTKCFRGTTVL